MRKNKKYKNNLNKYIESLKKINNKDKNENKRIFSTGRYIHSHSTIVIKFYDIDMHIITITFSWVDLFWKSSYWLSLQL